MPVIVEEAHIGRRSTGQQAERIYFLKGATTEAAARAALLTDPECPTVVDSKPRVDLECGVEELEAGRYLGTAIYRTPDLVIFPQPPPVGSFSVSFDITGQTTRITQSRATMEAKYRPGTFHQPDFRGAINVSADGSVEGTDIGVSFVTYSVNTVKSAAVVTDAWVATLAEIVGRVNNGLYRGFAAGELLLGRVTGSPRKDANNNDVFDLQFGFAVSKNKTNIIVANYPFGQQLKIDSKRGWDYLWVHYVEEEQDMGGGNGKRLVKVAHAAFVEQVYDYVSYAPLGI